MIKNLLFFLFPIALLTSCFGAKYGFTSKLIDTNNAPVTGAKIYFLNEKGDTLSTSLSDSNGNVRFEGRGNIRKMEKYTFRYSIVKTGYQRLYREDRADLIPDSLVLLPNGSHHDRTNKLSDKVETLEVQYTVWGCACPNWIRIKDAESNDTTRNYLGLHFYIEPADESPGLPNNFDAFKQHLKLTGQFYEKEDYPQGTPETEEPLPKARVFRYTKMEILENQQQ